MKKAIVIVCTSILFFLCGCAVGYHHAIMHADPWVDTEQNTILIDFDGAVHVYEYGEW